jgi:hypothetical protein
VKWADELPSDSEAAQYLLGETADDLPFRIHRFKTLIALDADFGGSGVMLPGGPAAYIAYLEARSSFVAGNFAATILLSQSLIENLLGGHLILDDVSREVRKRAPRTSKPLGAQPKIRPMLDHALEAGVLDMQDVDRILRLMDLRNPLVHFRDVNDPKNLTRRAMETGVHHDQIMYEDARFAMSTIISVVGKAQFAIGRFKDT